MKDGCIQTFTGRSIHPLDPRVEEIDLRDIAHALSLKCRFSGHCREFYSVGEHSVRVSRVLPAERGAEGGPEGGAARGGLALWGLMHDAAEAFLADVGRPIKPFIHVHHGGRIVTFDEAEERLLRVIATALEFNPIEYSAIAQADLVLLATEVRDLMGPPPEPWNLGVEALAERIVPWTAAEAEAAFLARYAELRQ